LLTCTLTVDPEDITPNVTKQSIKATCNKSIW